MSCTVLIRELVHPQIKRIHFSSNSHLKGYLLISIVGVYSRNLEIWLLLRIMELDGTISFLHHCTKGSGAAMAQV